MAGYWPSFFFACLYMDRDSRGPYTQEKPRSISRHLNRTSLAWCMAFGSISPAGHSGQSRKDKIAPCCPLGQPITAQDSVHLTRSRLQAYCNGGLLLIFCQSLCMWRFYQGKHQRAIKNVFLNLSLAKIQVTSVITFYHSKNKQKVASVLCIKHELVPLDGRSC